MRGRIARTSMGSLFIACLLVLQTVGCSGGGETAVIGFNNHGNTLGIAGLAEELADALADLEVTPSVSDEMIADVFAAILERARQGDAEAALIILMVAEEQREAEDG